MHHPLQYGDIFYSLGGHFCYRVVGPCCRLYDREELPWPCCRIQWRGKEPSWRRVGRRLVPDMATRNAPSYCVVILGQEATTQPHVITLYWDKLPAPLKEWWHSTKPHSDRPALPPAVDSSDGVSAVSVR